MISSLVEACKGCVRQLFKSLDRHLALCRWSALGGALAYLLTYTSGRQGARFDAGDLVRADFWVVCIGRGRLLHDALRGGAVYLYVPSLTLIENIENN